MGLPISVHLRGADPTGRRRRTARRSACSPTCVRADAVFSPYRDGQRPVPLGARRPRPGRRRPDSGPRVARCATRPGAGPPAGSTRAAARPGDRLLPVRPLRPGQRAGPVQRAAAHLADLAGYGWCLNAGGDVAACTRRPISRRGGSASRTRPTRPDPRASSNAATGAGGHLRLRPPRRAHHRPVHPPTGHGVRAVTVVGPELLWAHVYATAAAAARTVGAGLARRPRRLRSAAGQPVQGLQRVTAGWPVA